MLSSPRVDISYVSEELPPIKNKDIRVSRRGTFCPFKQRRLLTKLMSSGAPLRYLETRELFYVVRNEMDLF